MTMLLRLLAIALLFVGTQLPANASTTDLEVKGLIIPSACNVLLSDDGYVDHGKIPARSLKQNEFTELPSELLGLSITCEAFTLFALTGVDKNPDSSHSPLTLYGLGHNVHAPRERLGSVVLSLRGPVGDDMPLLSLASTDDGANWLPSNTLAPGWLMGFATIGNTLPRPIRQLVATLRIDSSVSPANSLTLHEEVPLDGAITLDLKYL